MTDPSASPPASQHRWQPLGAIDRRVAGVLAEKAKTTPDILSHESECHLHRLQSEEAIARP